MRISLLKILVFGSSTAVLSFFSCVATPKPALEPPAPEPAVVTPVVEEDRPLPGTEAVQIPAGTTAPLPFDPSTVSSALKESTFFDVKTLIVGLNSIIQAKDYTSWLAVLSSEYRAYYSSPETLAKISDAAILKRQGIVLKSLQDYFIYVVYPSRQNDRVDDIEFIAPDRIRAITINPKGERLVLYNLEKIGDTWKIAIWR